MVEFSQLPKSIVSGIAETLTQAADALAAMTPPAPMVIQNSDTQYVAATVQVPERKPRPVSSLDGAERIQNAFAGVPQVPGQIDFAYDPIARIHGHNVMALRLKGQTVVTTIQNWPTEGKFATALQDAMMAANGYSIMSLSEKDLGPMVVRALPALTAVGAGTALTIEFPQTNIQLSLETAVEIAKKSQTAGLAKFFVDSFIDFTAMAPVPGAGASAAAQAKMLERLPLPMRVEVVRDMNSIGRYAGSRSGFVGLSNVQRMATGFEQKADPIPSSMPVKQAGFAWLTALGVWLSSLVSRNSRPSSPAQLPPREPVAGRYDAPSRTEVISLDVPPAAARATALVDVANFHRPNAANIRLAAATQLVKFDIVRTSGGNSVDGQQVRYDNPTVSSHHARVSYDPVNHVVTVADLGSTNGTQVTIGRQPTVRLNIGSQSFDVRGETMVVIKCGDTTTSVYLKNGQGNGIVPSSTVPLRQGARMDVLPVSQSSARPVAAKPAPQQAVTPRVDLRETVAAIVRQFPQGIRGEYLPLRHGAFSADFRDAAGNIVRVQGLESLSPQVLSGIAKRLGTHVGNAQTRLPVSVIVHLVDAAEFNIQKEFRGINGQTVYRVETGGIVTIGQTGGNTMTSMSFGANEWGVATVLHPDTVSGRMLPSGIAMTVYMLAPETSAAVEGQMLRVITAVQNTLRPKLQASHPLAAEFLDGLK